MNGGNPVYGVSGNRPIISGNNYTVPGFESYHGLINVNNKDYIHIQDMEIYQSGDWGVWIAGDTNAGTNSACFLVKNVKVDGANQGGIATVRNSYNYGIIEDCEVTHTARYSKVNGGNWPVVLAVFQSPYSYTTIRNNYVHDNWGEGIGASRVGYGSDTDHSGYVTIEDNIVWNNRRVDIYICRTEGNIVRRNILLGAKNTAYTKSCADGRCWNQYGIWVNTENRGDVPSITNNNRVYNNLIAGHYSGLEYATAYDTGTNQNNVFYANTIIGNKYNLSIGHRLSGYTTSGIEFRNNVFWCPPGAVSQNIGHDYPWIDYKFTANHNAWTGSIPTYFGDIATDILLNSNSFATDIDWQDIKESDIPGIAEKFKLLSTSNAINAGVDLGSDYNTDYFGASRPQGNDWDIGAHELDLNTGNLDVNNPNSKVQLSIYPNPSNKNRITVTYELPGFSDVEIQIMDASGATIQVFKNKNRSGANALDITTTNYAPGMYFCKLVTGDAMAVKKFIIQ